MQDTTEAPVAHESHAPFADVFRSIIDRAGAKLVYGEPITAGGRTIVPVAKIRYGFGGGAGGKRTENQHGGGGGGGLVAQPLGVVEVTASGTRFIPVASNWTVLAAVAVGICLGWSVVQVAKG